MALVLWAGEPGSGSRPHTAPGSFAAELALQGRNCPREPCQPCAQKGTFLKNPDMYKIHKTITTVEGKNIFLPREVSWHLFVSLSLFTPPRGLPRIPPFSSSWSIW